MEDIVIILGYIALTYAVLYTGSKLIISIVSLVEIKKYFGEYSHVITEKEYFQHLQLNKHEMPMISIVSPAYNESVVIIDTVTSFLEQAYQHKEVIISCDGSTDDTLQKLIQHFDLIPVEDTYQHSPTIPHKPIKQYFRSINPKYNELIVLDKENGGKADAQNAAIAIASGEIITIIDADSILEKHALIHLAEVFERESSVVGIGTPIGIVNDSKIGPDGVDDASVPKSFWAKIQVIEYLRSFMLGRMFAQRYRGLLIVSGAFGVYKKWIIEAVHGYTNGSLAEDMDIDGKIWRYIDDHKLKHEIRYIPEAFCWSEVPETLKSFATQRDRWSRGMTETMWKNRDLFLNRRYGLLGMFSYPYYLFFEWLTPFIEIGGLAFLLVGTMMGYFDWTQISIVLFIYWTISSTINLTALGVEAMTRGHYKDRRTHFKLAIYSLMEPLFYHWVNSFIYVLGNFRLVFLRKRGWGESDRVSMNITQPMNGNPAAEKEGGLKESVQDFFT